MKIFIDQNAILQLPKSLLGFSKIRLLECRLYNSWFNINKNNRLKFHNGTKWLNKKIEAGNYNIESLAERLGKITTLKLKQ